MSKFDEKLKDMEPDIWHPKFGELNQTNVIKLMEKINDYDFELTFNSDYTKIKKTLWKNNKPV